MKVIAQHPTLGRKDFSIPVWESIQKWDGQGGWTLVKDQPVEAAHESQEPAKEVKTRKK